MYPANPRDTFNLFYHSLKVKCRFPGLFSHPRKRGLGNGIDRICVQEWGPVPVFWLRPWRAHKGSWVNELFSGNRHAATQDSGKEGPGCSTPCRAYRHRTICGETYVTGFPVLSRTEGPCVPGFFRIYEERIKTVSKNNGSDLVLVLDPSGSG